MTIMRYGPPAFPFIEKWTNDSDRNATAPSGEVVPPGVTVEITWYGMTMRDYFAAKAMEGQLSGPLASDSRAVEAALRKAGLRDPMDLFARNSYDMADAMLKARQA